MKRYLSILLMITMLLTQLPMEAYAEDAKGENVTEIEVELGGKPITIPPPIVEGGQPPIWEYTTDGYNTLLNLNEGIFRLTGSEEFGLGERPYIINIKSDAELRGNKWIATSCVINCSGRITQGEYQWRYNDSITIEKSGAILGGSYDSEGSLYNNGLILGGEFNNLVENKADGTIKGGVFSKKVTNDGIIESGTFKGNIDNYEGGIKNGVFYGNVVNSGWISYGIFYGDITGMGRNDLKRWRQFKINGVDTSIECNAGNYLVPGNKYSIQIKSDKKIVGLYLLDKDKFQSPRTHYIADEFGSLSGGTLYEFTCPDYDFWICAVPESTINFELQPKNKVFTVGQINGSLNAKISVVPFEETKLEWFSCTEDGTLTGKALGTGEDYTIPENLGIGTHYYRCVASGATAGKVESRIAKVEVGIPPTITTESLPNAKAGARYEQQLTATGTGPITWRITKGRLPWGLTLSETTGIISGTPDKMTVGTNVITVEAQSIRGTAQKEFTITVAGESEAEVLTITTESLPNAMTGVEYSQQLAATGAVSITWSIIGSLPSGLKLSDTGTISGKPDQMTVGTYAITVVAQSTYGFAQKQLSITVEPGVPTITTESLPNAIVGVNYSQQLAATGAGWISWRIAEGSLPSGWKLKDYGNISGVMYEEINEKFTVEAKNAYGFDQKEFTIVSEKLTITTESLPHAKAGVEYSQQLAANGDVSLTWSIAEGSLPEGLSLDKDTGIISGTPTDVNQSSDVRVSVRAFGGIYDASKMFTITVEPADVQQVLVITTESLPNAIVGMDYSCKLDATGTAPITWSIAEGNLPDGLSLNGDTGIISGTPTGKEDTLSEISFKVRLRTPKLIQVRYLRLSLIGF